MADFIREIIEDDLASGRHDRIVTRFPPEPNGYLHLGHAKSVVLNHDLSEEYPGEFHLRFDDTNPLAEDEEYVESIKEDVAWLGADWGDHLYFASDYFDRMYELAEGLVREGLAYVDSLSSEQIKQQRGDTEQPGEESPYRDRPVDENLDLLRRMKAGEFDEGEHVLRAKIDMSHPNTLMRDPVIYRILHADHHRTEDNWCIYPMYDYAHCLEDALEGITHSLCTLEFRNNRALYDWFIEHTDVDHQPRQIEFGAGEIEYTVLSKSRLGRLVDEGHVEGWDDPRMPTLSGLRNRGVPPEAIREFWREIGVSKNEGTVEISRFERAVRDALKEDAPRLFCVEDPLRVDLLEDPFGEDRKEKEIRVERDDFQRQSEEGFYRLTLLSPVRLKGGPVIGCVCLFSDPSGLNRIEATYVDEDKHDQGVIHWVDIDDARPVSLKLYDRLFDERHPSDLEDLEEALNESSLVEKEGLVEASADDQIDVGQRVQFERKGYFLKTGEAEYSQIVPLKGAWEREEKERRKRKANERRREKQRRKQQKKQTSKKAEEIRREGVLRVARGEDPPASYDLTDRDRRRREDADLREAFLDFYVDRDLPLDESDVLSGSRRTAELFRSLSPSRPEKAASVVVHEVLPRLEEEESLPDPDQLRPVVEAYCEGDISSVQLEEVLEQGLDSDQSMCYLLEKTEVVRDEADLREIVEDIGDAHPDEVQKFQEGKDGLVDFFVGQVMAETDGRADPEKAHQVIREAFQS